MRVTKIFYERLKKRAEPFENERAGIEVSLSKGDDPALAWRAARVAVDRELDDGLDHSQVEAAAAAIASVAREEMIKKGTRIEVSGDVDGWTCDLWVRPQGQGFGHGWLQTIDVCEAETEERAVALASLAWTDQQ